METQNRGAALNHKAVLGSSERHCGPSFCEDICAMRDSKHSHSAGSGMRGRLDDELYQPQTGEALKLRVKGAEDSWLPGFQVFSRSRGAGSGTTSARHSQNHPAERHLEDSPWAPSLLLGCWGCVTACMCSVPIKSLTFILRKLKKKKNHNVGETDSCQSTYPRYS